MWGNYATSGRLDAGEPRAGFAVTNERGSNHVASAANYSQQSVYDYHDEYIFFHLVESAHATVDGWVRGYLEGTSRNRFVLNVED
jgi:hypothetical protein